MDLLRWLSSLFIRFHVINFYNVLFMKKFYIAFHAQRNPRAINIKINGT